MRKRLATLVQYFHFYEIKPGQVKEKEASRITKDRDVSYYFNQGNPSDILFFSFTHIL